MNKANLSVFASGVGSNLLAIHNASMHKSFPGKLQQVICNKICPAFELAKSLNYNTKLISNLDKEKFEVIVHQELIKKRQHNQKLTLNERKKLDHALFVNYCSCVKSLKYDKTRLKKHIYIISRPDCGKIGVSRARSSSFGLVWAQAFLAQVFWGFTHDHQ